MSKLWEFKNTTCPVCKVTHEAYFNYKEPFTDHRCSSCNSAPYEVGQKVILHPMRTLHTVERYFDNLCGDGCCPGYKLSGVEDYQWAMDVEGVYE